jgi:pyruvate/2-oxoglutarate dehydrogenase complex dihydrolipoamide dehydrogenase (E3) component
MRKSGKSEAFDAVIIGSGQGGTPLALALARAGRRTAIVEEAHVGGTCVNVGCTPTKTLIASARAAALARRAEELGLKALSVEPDIRRIMARKQELVASFRAGSRRRIEQAENLTLLGGKARFTSDHTLEVKSADGGIRSLRAEQIFINAGGRPALPDLPGLESLGFLDSTSIMEVDELPGHLLVLGGGYIGLEFGQMFRRFGSRVTIIQRGPQLLSREDADVAAAVAEVLAAEGIEVYLEAAARRVEPGGESGLRLTFTRGGEEQQVEGTHLLVAAGRIPNTDALGLENTSVKTDRRGFVKVNESLETGAAGIFALGDVKGGPAFTHISYDDYRILAANLISGEKRTTRERMVPYTVFIDPQLGRVGLSEKEARQRGLEYKVAKMPMNWVARALEVGESRGFMKALVDPRTDKILGCAVLGLEGGEIMAMLQIAMMGGLPYQRLRDGVFAHPTLAESLNNLFASFA